MKRPTGIHTFQTSVHWSGIFVKLFPQKTLLDDASTMNIGALNILGISMSTIDIDLQSSELQHTLRPSPPSHHPPFNFVESLTTWASVQFSPLDSFPIQV